MTGRPSCGDEPRLQTLKEVESSESNSLVKAGTVEGIGDKICQCRGRLSGSRWRGQVWTVKEVVDVASAELRDDFMTIVRISVSRGT